jgi:hypothetical protein
MKMKLTKSLFVAAALFLAGQVTVSAQSLKSVLSSVASAVTSSITSSTATAESLVGSWAYNAPDCQFESDNLLAKAGGEAAAKKVETKMKTVMTKVGISSSNCKFTFNSDGSYTQTIKGKTISGTYTFDSSKKAVTLTPSTLGVSYVAYVSVSGSKLSLLFKANKLLSLLQTTSGLASSASTTLSTLSTLSSQYSGMLMGFEMKKQ